MSVTEKQLKIGRSYKAGKAKVRPISDAHFQGNTMTAYRDVLTFCIKNLGQAVEWPATETLDFAEARRIQNGFHSSGLGRDLRPTHKILTAVVKVNGDAEPGQYKIQVKVEKKTAIELEAEAIKKQLTRGRRAKPAETTIAAPVEPCAPCGGTKKVFDVVTGVEQDCPSCGGTGQSPVNDGPDGEKTVA